MNKWQNYKAKIKEQYSIDLTEEEFTKLKKQVNKAAIPDIIGVLIGTIVILFIVVGLVFEYLPFNEYTIIPLVVVVVLLITGANSLTKKTKKAEQKFIASVKSKSNMITPVAPQSLISKSNHHANPQTTGLIINQPKAAENCPICNELIPIDSNPCPKCGSKLLWD